MSSANDKPAPAIVLEQAQHLAMLAMSPGWRQHVAHRIDELEACRSGLWRGLRHEVNAAVRAAKMRPDSGPNGSISETKSQDITTKP